MIIVLIRYQKRINEISDKWDFFKYFTLCFLTWLRVVGDTSVFGVKKLRKSQVDVYNLFTKSWTLFWHSNLQNFCGTGVQKWWCHSFDLPPHFFSFISPYFTHLFLHIRHSFLPAHFFSFRDFLLHETDVTSFEGTADCNSTGMNYTPTLSDVKKYLIYAISHLSVFYL